ncbi:MAG: hypothetical protein M3217_02355, partial [Actinomycetota bacterium]|nr:hypothetical protein [Actinomycetota bacterium]
LVDLLSGTDEQRPALLQVKQRKRRDTAAPIGHQGAGRPRAQLAEPRLAALEDVVGSRPVPRVSVTAIIAQGALNRRVGSARLRRRRR